MRDWHRNASKEAFSAGTSRCFDQLQLLGTQNAYRPGALSAAPLAAELAFSVAELAPSAASLPPGVMPLIVSPRPPDSPPATELTSPRMFPTKSGTCAGSSVGGPAYIAICAASFANWTIVSGFASNIAIQRIGWETMRGQAVRSIWGQFSPIKCN